MRWLPELEALAEFVSHFCPAAVYAIISRTLVLRPRVSALARCSPGVARSHRSSRPAPRVKSSGAQATSPILAASPGYVLGLNLSPVWWTQSPLAGPQPPCLLVSGGVWALWKSWVLLLKEASGGWAAKIQHRSPMGMTSLPPAPFRTFGEIKFTIKNLLKKIPSPDGCKSYETFKEGVVHFYMYIYI